MKELPVEWKQLERIIEADIEDHFESRDDYRRWRAKNGLPLRGEKQNVSNH